MLLAARHGSGHEVPKLGQSLYDVLLGVGIGEADVALAVPAKGGPRKQGHARLVEGPFLELLAIDPGVRYAGEGVEKRPPAGDSGYPVSAPDLRR